MQTMQVEQGGTRPDLLMWWKNYAKQFWLMVLFCGAYFRGVVVDLSARMGAGWLSSSH